MRSNAQNKKDHKLTKYLQNKKNKKLANKSQNKKRKKLTNKSNKIIKTTKEAENKTKFINMIKEKLHLKNHLSYKIANILYNTDYTNTNINQYINYTKLLNIIKKTYINATLIDPSKLLIKPFFTKKYADKLDLKITDKQGQKLYPVISRNAEFYLEKYFVYICRNKILLDKNRYRISKHPKLSIIIPIYNRAKYIETILLSIQNQNVKDIEIIFIDDMSKDNSIEIIKKFMNEDNRIVLLKNNKNSGTFYTRFVGLVFSKGNYIAFADSDDFFLPDILGNAYKTGIKKKVEIVQWYILKEYRNGNVKKGKGKHKTGIKLNKNQLKYFMFYEHHKNFARIENLYLWDKIYKRNLLLRTMHKFPDDLINEHLCIHDDNLFLFTIFQNANSYYFIDKYGYYFYRGETKSITSNYGNPKSANKSFHDIFKIFKFIFNYTPNKKRFKMMCFANFKNLMFYHGYKLRYVTEGIEFIKEVLNLYINCRFYSKKMKKRFIRILNKLNKNKID